MFGESALTVLETLKALPTLTTALTSGLGAAAHTTSVSPAFYLAIVLYGVSALMYIGAFTKSPDWVVRAAKWILVVGFVAHGADISMRAIDKVHPGTSVREALGFLSWAIVGGFLLASVKHRLNILGAFVGPLGLGILAMARLSSSGKGTDGLTTLGRIHISMATLGVAIFAIATGLAVVYLVQERTLKSKRFDGVLLKRGVALESLDRLSHRLVLVGFPIFTAALMLGVIWVSQRASSFDRPEYPLAAITWAAFAALIVTRTTWGWRGRKTALMTIIGFAAAIVVFAIYFVRRVV